MANGLSLSEEKSMSDSAHLDQLAFTVGYRYVQVVNNQKDLRHAILHFRQGPGFIVAKIELGGRRDFRRPLELVEVKDRFMQFLHQP